MLDNPVERAAVAKKIVSSTAPKRRPKDYDGAINEGVDSYAGKITRGSAVRFEVPATDSVITEDIIEWMQQVGFPHLLRDLRSTDSEFVKRLIVQSAATTWSAKFRKWGKEE